MLDVDDRVFKTASDIVDRVRNGAFVSYAQNYEDVMLSRAFSNQTGGFYVDVGAFHASYNSVTKAFYDAGWRGVNIDANSNAMSSLYQDRPRDKNIATAVSDKCVEAEIFLSEGKGWSTMNRDLAGAYAARNLFLKTSKVQTQTLEGIFRTIEETTVDFLKIDVEGHEYEVIMGNDWSKYRPRIVVVEAAVPEILRPMLSPDELEGWSRWEQKLRESAYELVYFDGLNCFYVREEDGALGSAFSRPPNFFDNFVRAHELELANAVVALTNGCRR